MLDYYYYAGAGVVRLGVVLCKGLVRGDGGVPEPDHSPPPHPGSRLLRSQQSSGSDCPTSRAAWQLQSAPAAFSHKLPHLFSQRTRNANSRGHLLRALPGSLSWSRACLLLHTFLHLLCRRCHFCRQLHRHCSSLQLSSEPAPPAATRRSKQSL